MEKWSVRATNRPHFVDHRDTPDPDHDESEATEANRGCQGYLRGVDLGDRRTPCCDSGTVPARVSATVIERRRSGVPLSVAALRLAVEVPRDEESKGEVAMLKSKGREVDGAPK